MAPKAALLLCAALAAVDGWKAPPQKLLKPLATKLLEASLLVSTLGALPAVAAPPTQQHAPSRKYLFVTGFPFPLGPITERRTVQSELVKSDNFVCLIAAILLLAQFFCKTTMLV